MNPFYFLRTIGTLVCFLLTTIGSQVQADFIVGGIQFPEIFADDFSGTGTSGTRNGPLELNQGDGLDSSKWQWTLRQGGFIQRNGGGTALIHASKLNADNNLDGLSDHNPSDIARVSTRSESLNSLYDAEQWAYELIFSVPNTDGPLASSNRQSFLLYGAGAGSTVVTDVGLYLGPAGSDGTDPFRILWGNSDFGNTSTGNLTEITGDLQRNTTYTLGVRHTTTDQNDIYLDGQLLGTFAALGSGPPRELFFGDEHGATGAGLVLDSFKVGALLSPERIWQVDATGDWNSPLNWDGGPPPNANDQDAVFGSAITAPRTVYTNSDVTVRSVTFDSPDTYAVAGAGSVNLEFDSGNAAIDVDQGDHQFQGKVNFVSDLDLDISASASLTLQNRVDFGSSTVTKTGAGMLAIKSNLNSGSGTMMVQAGTLTGGGTIGGSVVLAGGTLSAGNSPGVTTITGNYDQQAAATLDIEIGGTTAAAEFDVLDVASSATLAGMLEVRLVDLGGGVFAPTAGNAYEILTADTLSGTFSGGVSLPALTGQLSWNVNYDTFGNRVLLEVLTPFTADFDGDGDVDSDDLVRWQGDYGTGGNSDANGDGDSDGADFLIWQRQFTGDLSPLLSATAAVPEPSSMMLLVGMTVVSVLVGQRHFGAKCPILVIGV